MTTEEFAGKIVADLNSIIPFNMRDSLSVAFSPSELSPNPNGLGGFIGTSPASISTLSRAPLGGDGVLEGLSGLTTKSRGSGLSGYGTGGGKFGVKGEGGIGSLGLTEINKTNRSEHTGAPYEIAEAYGNVIARDAKTSTFIRHIRSQMKTTFPDLELSNMKFSITAVFSNETGLLQGIQIEQLREHSFDESQTAKWNELVQDAEGRLDDYWKPRFESKPMHWWNGMNLSGQTSAKGYVTVAVAVD